MTEQLTVRSHVARDLLQTAALFKSDRAVAWEYVSNAIDYVDEGVIPTVYVHIDTANKKISITDNGRGMDWKGLQNFFTMHGENLDRKSGRPKRGLFGTGKSAAFGIAETLRVRTVRTGKRSTVELSRSKIQQMGSVDPVPIQVIEKEVPTQEANGTRIDIEGIGIKKIDQSGVINHIQQHLSQMTPNAKVYVNHHECEYREPASVLVRTFKPSENERPALGDVELIIKVAGAPLDEFERGVAISSNGVFYERTLAGMETKDMAQYLFGRLDVPLLDRELETANIAPVDMSRNLKLNPENRLVANIYSFIGQKLEQVRQEIADRERERKRSEEAKKLASEARQIADAINADFNEFREKVARISARSRGSIDNRVVGRQEDGAEIVSGKAINARESVFPGAVGSEGGSRKGGKEPRTLQKHLDPTETGDRKGDPAAPMKAGPTSRGGFQVRFEHMGSGEMRAKYVRDERTIFVNLDHPQLLAAKGSGSEEQRLFRQLSYEIAFSEYAIALASELDREGEYIEPSDAIVDMRNTVNRLARRAASLFG